MDDEPNPRGYRVNTGSGSESPPPPPTHSGLEMQSVRDARNPWIIRWHKREALLRDLIAHWRAPAIERRVFPSPTVDPIRARFADELEAVLDAAEPIGHGGLPV